MQGTSQEDSAGPTWGKDNAHSDNYVVWHDLKFTIFNPKTTTNLYCHFNTGIFSSSFSSISNISLQKKICEVLRFLFVSFMNIYILKWELLWIQILMYGRIYFHPLWRHLLSLSLLWVKFVMKEHVWVSHDIEN